MTRPTQLTIDKKALQHNLQRVRDFAPQSHVVAMVKANAYGHGIAETVSAFADTDAFGVCCIEEADVIRQHSRSARVVLMEGVFTTAELSHASKASYDIIVHHQQQIDMLEKSNLVKPLRVWLKVNSGMHRLGIAPESFAESLARLKACANVQPDIILMTHFADADEPEKPTTNQQIQVFNTLSAEHTFAKSLANSAAILSRPDTHVDWVRPGIMLYGISPFANKIGRDFDLMPVMHFHSELIAIQSCKKGDAIAYGGRWVCPEDMLIGVVAVGYGDGYPRHAKDGTPVLVKGKPTQLVGRVSMDLLTVDLRNIAEPKIGDTVTLWGNDLPIEQVAIGADTIAYELTCTLTPRVPRIVIG